MFHIVSSHFSITISIFFSILVSCSYADFSLSGGHGYLIQLLQLHFGRCFWGHGHWSFQRVGLQ